jgi:hypothetical protein
VGAGPSTTSPSISTPPTETRGARSTTMVAGMVARRRRRSSNTPPISRPLARALRSPSVTWQPSANRFS